jgi:hypothetical protein
LHTTTCHYMPSLPFNGWNTALNDMPHFLRMLFLICYPLQYCVKHNGFLYRALNGSWDPAGSQDKDTPTSTRHIFQRRDIVLLPLPPLYELAPAHPHCLEVCGAYPWNTHFMMLENGDEICTVCIPACTCCLVFAVVY